MLLVLLAVVVPWQLSLLGQLPSSIDFILQYYPNLAFLGSSLKAGELPLWNPHVFAGTPYLADPQSAALYFPNWPFLLLLDTMGAARAIVVAHYALAALGSYSYLRVVRLSPAAALVGATLFGVSEYTITQVAGIPLLVNLAWIPVVLLLVELSLQRGSFGYALAAAAAMAMQLFNGWPHGLYITSFALLATFLWHAASGAVAARNWKPAGRATLLMAIMAATWAGLGAVLLLPAAEFAGQSNYLMDRGLEVAGGEGNVTVLAVLGIGGSEGHGVYMGALGVLLVLTGILHGDDRKRVMLYLLLGAFSLLAAFGTKAPLYAYLYRWSPAFQTFHTPGRFMVLYLFSASALAAYGAEALLRIGQGRDEPACSPPASQRGRGRPVGLPLPGTPFDIPALVGLVARNEGLSVAGLALLLLAPLYYTMSRMFGPDAFGLLANNLIHWAEGPYLPADIARHLLGSGVVGALFLAAIASRRLSGRAAFSTAFVLLLTDLFLMRSLGAQYFAAPPDLFQKPPAAVSELEQGEYRSMGYARNGTLHFLSDFPRNLINELSPPNLAMVFGREDVQGYNPLQLRRYAQYLAAINGGPDDYHWALIYNFQSRLLDLLNLRYVALRGDDSRLRNVTIATGLNLEGTGQSRTVHLPPVRATGLQVHSYLGNSTQMQDGQVAARLRIVDTTGQVWSFDLRVGIETAEWAYDRPDVRLRVQHQRARVSMTWNLPSPVHTYVADLPFPQPMDVAEVTLERVEPGIFIVVPEVAAVPEQPLQRYEEVDEAEGTRLFRNNWALPRALLVPSAEVIEDPVAVLERLQSDGFDPRQVVLLEEGPDVPARQGTEGEPGEVHLLSRTNNRVRLEARAASGGFLLMNELSYPGWNAYVDGQPARVWRANYLFRAIEISSGVHEVEFHFEPDSLKLGLALSLTTLALLLAAAVLRLKSRWRWKENTPR